jgi:hypothetical protein
MGPFAGSKADGIVFIETTPQARTVMILLHYRLFSETVYPRAIQVFTGIKATWNVHEIAYNTLMVSIVL